MGVFFFFVVWLVGWFFFLMWFGFFLVVDAAAREKDPLKRIAFVAAFAMSNYSSTIGRIAKPFNPMLVCYVCPWELRF